MDAIQHWELRAVLQQAVDELSERCRVVDWMPYRHDLNPREIDAAK